MPLSMAGAASSMSGTVGDSILGAPQKAVLILFTGESKRQLKNSDISNIAASALSKSAESLVGSMITGAAGAGALPATGLGNFRVLEVQYNPNTIQLQANAEEQPMLFLQQNLEQGVPNQLLRPPSVTLHVDLFFDAVNLADSFMWEKFTMGLSGQTVSNIASTAAKNAGKVWSVQEQTNGLLGAVMHKNTRFIIFKWADMTFAGELTEAIANYTMFSTTGRPVRSNVTIRITQNVESRDDIKYWNEAFDKVIANSLERKQRSTLENMQNLMTFNF